MIGAVRIEPCGHSFDAACLSSWFRNELICPQCRAVAVEVKENTSLRQLVEAAITAGVLEAPEDRQQKFVCCGPPLPGRIDIIAKQQRQQRELAEQLNDAALNGDADTMAQLLTAPGVLVNAQILDGGSTPLILACVEGHDAVVQQLIAAPGIDVNVSDDDGNTPLILAAFHNHRVVVAQLLAVEEIDANAKDTLGNSALFCACNATLSCCLTISLCTISRCLTITLSHYLTAHYLTAHCLTAHYLTAHCLTAHCLTAHYFAV